MRPKHACMRANSDDPDQTAPEEQSDLGLQRLPRLSVPIHRMFTVMSIYLYPIMFHFQSGDFVQRFMKDWLKLTSFTMHRPKRKIYI